MTTGALRLRSGQAFRTLTRHFVDASLAPEVLTELGADYLRRLLFGLLAVLLVIGIFVPRIFFKKYTDLGALVGSEAYLKAVQADTLFIIAVPMVLIGLAAVIAGPLLFPDETDYRVLTPLPISRAQLFGAKLAAVAVVVLACVLAVNLIVSFWFPIAVSGRKAQHPMLARVVAHAIASTAGSVFTCVAVMAAQGLLIVAVPQAWQRRMSVLVQGAIAVALLLSLPLIGRMPSMNVTEATVIAAPLAWMPPAWFLGLEWWLLKGAAAGGYARAAGIGAMAFAIAVVTVAGSYLILYRSAERLAGVAGADRRSGAPRPPRAWPLLARLAPQTLAILDFVRIGLGRSRLHQFVFMFALGGGIAMLIGRIAAVIEGTTPFASRPGAAVDAAVSAPLLIALTFVLGMRAAFRWPLDRPASWIFRLTESAATRSVTLDGARWWLSTGAVTVALVTAAVLQPRVLGAAWWLAAVLTTIAVMTLVECVFIDWRRVPFACTYLPGKHVLAYHLGVLFAWYFVVVLIGGSVMKFSVTTPSRATALGGFLIAGWAIARRERIKTWGLLALEFEDDDPAEVSVLRLETSTKPGRP